MPRRAFFGFMLFAVVLPVLLVSQRGGTMGASVVTAQAAKSCSTLRTCISSMDSSRPPRLNGRGGQPPDYNFNDTADANQSGAGATLKYIYEHQIQNKNPKTVLWAEWHDATIPFQLIQPCDCAPGY